MASHADRLKALHADLNFFNHVKFFIRDLLEHSDDFGSRIRLFLDPSCFYYMSSVYFTPKQMDFLISFKGRDGRTLGDTLESTIAPKIQQFHKDSMSRYFINPAHDVAPVFQDVFGVRKGFLDEPGFQRLFDKFAKKQLD